MTLRGSPTPPGYRRQTSSPVVKVNSTTSITYGQAELDATLAATIATKTSEIATLTANVSTLESQLAQKVSELETANGNLQKLQTSYNALVDDYDSTVEQLTFAESQIVALTAEVATKQSQIDDLVTDLATANAALIQAQADLATAQSDLATSQADLATANATIADLQDQLANQPSGDVVMQPINEDLSTWNYFDNAQSPLVSYSYDANTTFHSVTLPEMATAAECWIGTTSGTVTIPEFYKPLTYADGSPVLNTDAFILQTSITEFTFSGATGWSVCLGTMNDVLGTINSTRDAFGTGVWIESQSEVGPMAANVTSYRNTSGFPVPQNDINQKGFAITLGSAKLRMGSMSGIYTGNLTKGTVQGSASTAYTPGNSFDEADGTQMNLVLFFSTAASTIIPQSGTMSFKLSYAVEKW